MASQLLSVGFVVLIPFSALLSAVGLWIFWQTGLAVSGLLSQHDNSQSNNSGTGNNLSMISRRKSQMSTRRSESAAPGSNYASQSTQWVLYLTVLCSASFFLGNLMLLIYSIMVVIRLYDSNHDSDERLTNQRVYNIEKHKDLQVIWVIRQVAPNIGYVSLITVCFLRMVSVFVRTQYALSSQSISTVKWLIIGGLGLICVHRIIEVVWPSNQWSWLLIAPVAMGYPTLSCWIAYRFYHTTRLIAINLSTDLPSLGSDISQDRSPTLEIPYPIKSVSISTALSMSPNATSQAGLMDENVTKGTDLVAIDHAHSPIPAAMGADSPQSRSPSASPMAESVTNTSIVNWPSAMDIHADLDQKKTEEDRKSSAVKTSDRKKPNKSSKLMHASIKLTLICNLSIIGTVAFILFWYAAIIIGDFPVLRLLHLYLFPIDSFMNLLCILLFFRTSDPLYYKLFGRLHRFLSQKLAQRDMINAEKDEMM